MSIELPPAPTQAEGESLADFQTRHLIWWREGDLAQRVACHNMKAAWLASIEPNVGPTLTRLADAWDSLDTRLGELAAALTGQTAEPAPVAGSDAARVAVTALLGEIGERTPDQVATAALARMGAADRVLGGEATAP